MKYIFLISSVFQFLDFTVLANVALDNYYKSMTVLNVYHEKFTTHLRNEVLQLSLGPRSLDYSVTTLLLQEEEKNVPDLVMRRDDILWNHLYLSATPLQPPTLAQNFANGFAWFSAFREMLNFRVGALYYKKKNNNELSENCSTMAAYLTMFQLIMMQDRLFEFGNIIDDYNREITSSFLPNFLKPAKDSTSGRDALATAKNMELLSRVTAVLNQVVERRTVRQQYPVTPFDPWIFPTNEEQAATRRGAVDAVKQELAFDFYLREAPAEEAAAAAAAPVQKLERLELEESRLEISEAEDVERSAGQRRERPMETSQSQAEASSSAVPEQADEVRSKSEPSEEEKEREWRNHSEYLKPIDEKCDIVGKDYDTFYYKCLWKELLAVYGDAFVQVLEYFHFAISGSSYRSSVERWTDSFEDYVPNMDESVAVWEKAGELLGIAEADYPPDRFSPEKDLKSHPIAVLQTIETIRYTRRDENAIFDENRLRTELTLQYVNPRDASADLKVV